MSVTAVDAPALAAPHQQLLDRLGSVMGRQVFFVVGCQKSGTTWVQKLLDGHPAVRCHGEAYFVVVLAPLLKQMTQVYNQRQKAGDAGKLGDADVRDLLVTTMSLSMSRWLDDKPEALAIGEKTPEHAQCLPALSACFPQAKFIHIIRDGRDACVSGWFHNQRKAGPKFKQNFPTLSRYIEYMVQHHWLPYIQQAQAYGAQAPDRYLELRYEDLHADPLGCTSRMLGFLGVDDSDAAVRACVEAGSFESLSAGRPRGQEDASSFFRKGVVGDWRNHFDDEAERTFMRVGGDLLRKLGYAAP